MTLVFVYGTLMTGERYHALLGGHEPITVARTAAQFRLHDLGPYPAMVRGTSHVCGELYEVSDAILVTLDELEDHPTLYRRELIALDDDVQASAYLYWAPLRGAPAISSGDWRLR